MIRKYISFKILVGIGVAAVGFASIVVVYGQSPVSIEASRSVSFITSLNGQVSGKIRGATVKQITGDNSFDIGIFGMNFSVTTDANTKIWSSQATNWSAFSSHGCLGGPIGCPSISPLPSPPIPFISPFPTPSSHGCLGGPIGCPSISPLPRPPIPSPQIFPIILKVGDVINMDVSVDTSVGKLKAQFIRIVSHPIPLSSVSPIPSPLGTPTPAASGSPSFLPINSYVGSVVRISGSGFDSFSDLDFDTIEMQTDVGTIFVRIMPTLTKIIKSDGTVASKKAIHVGRNLLVIGRNTDGDQVLAIFVAIISPGQDITSLRSLLLQKTLSAALVRKYLGENSAIYKKLIANLDVFQALIAEIDALIVKFSKNPQSLPYRAECSAAATAGGLLGDKIKVEEFELMTGHPPTSPDMNNKADRLALQQAQQADIGGKRQDLISGQLNQKYASQQKQVRILFEACKAAGANFWKGIISKYTSQL